MKFSELVDSYIKKLHCTAKELADASGLSAAVISRYRTGEREPNPDSDQLQKLVSGITRLADAKGIPGITDTIVLSELQDSLNQKNTDYENFITNFDTLIKLLDVNMKALSAATNFDTSYLYRIRSGQRRPNDLNAFCNSFCEFITTRYNNPSDKEKVAALLECTVDHIEQHADYMSHLRNWLYQSKYEEPTDYLGNFLKNLDQFNLDEFIRAIHFDELKVPSMPFHFPTSKTYYGVEEMRKGELDFFKSTVLSKSKEPIFMCSDMPMEDMAKDMDFNRKWMFAIAMSLKKGLHLNIIHNIDRPFHEMMLGLESWIPIYMTGQVSPYYFPNLSTSIYHHFNYVSGVAALTGECINGCHKNGKYYLTNNKEEVAYYKQKAVDLLSKAQPLMDIYRASSGNLFYAFLVSDSKETGNRHNILSTLPIYTISEELLQHILSRADIPEADQKRILDYAKEQHSAIETTLQHGSVLDEIAELTAQEFEEYPMALSISDIFYETDIFYNYEEYRAHLQLTKAFAKNHENYTLKLSCKPVFRNIQIHILENKYVRISKNKTPIIHFVIHHPKMVNALSNFIAPVNEG